MASYAPLPPQLTLPQVGAQPKQIGPWLPGQAPSQQPGYVGQADPNQGQGYAPGAGSRPPGVPAAGGPGTAGVGIDGFGPITSNYIRAFNASLANQRGAIDQQLAQALGELGQRRDAAAGVIATLPGAVGTNVHSANAALGSAGAAGAAALDPGAAATVGVGVPQLQSGIKAQAQGYTNEVPVLNLANMANSQGGEALLNSSAMQAKAGLAQQQQDFLQQLSMQQLQSKIAEDQYGKHAAIDEHYRQIDAKTAADQQKQAAADAAAQAAGLDSGQELTQLQSSPAYQYAVNSMTHGIYSLTGASGDSLPGPLSQLAGPNDMKGAHLVKLTGAEIAAKYAATNPKLVYALLAGGHLSTSDLVAAGLAAPAPTANPLGK